MTAEQILRVLEAKRRLHPEARGPLDWAGLRRILARERVPLEIVPLPTPAKLAQVGGEWTIFLSDRVPPRRYTYYGAHELAHLWLHVDAAGIERWETVFHVDDWHGEDEREDDAEFLAMCLLLGAQLE